ncbi:predicted protein [Plenodomus lingam JN3]|uniref:Predicted protein n=1 Tax=Leptosphaeria maculans (strain JN3 / isolate v23.1.3 / race Av1-4-5-6-7-8) TaxID=985895 RepID=E5AFP3_LEPMJ|nr:predicted protein [Plenodomus lingam JN3]CBY02032.1 predicted protein [Plenodomus lingam JN3]
MCSIIPHSRNTIFPSAQTKSPPHVKHILYNKVPRPRTPIHSILPSPPFSQTETVLERLSHGAVRRMETMVRVCDGRFRHRILLLHIA